MRLSSRLHRFLAKWSSGDRQETFSAKLPLQLAGETIEAVRRVGISKAHNLTYTGIWQGRRVRINQVFNATHATFIEHIATLSPLKDYFPIHFFREGRYLVVEWVEGYPLTINDIKNHSETLDALVSMQGSFHKLPFPTETSGFDYTKFLEERFHRYRDVWPLSDAFAILFERLHHHQPLPERSRLSHPDVTLANIVRRKESGALVLVDNELLNASPYYLIDVFNTYHRLPDQGLRGIYLSLYQRYGPEPCLTCDGLQPLIALWGLRSAGAALQAGKFDLAYRIAEEVVAGKLDTHPMLRMLQEKWS